MESTSRRDALEERCDDAKEMRGCGARTFVRCGGRRVEVGVVFAVRADAQRDCSGGMESERRNARKKQQASIDRRQMKVLKEHGECLQHKRESICDLVMTLIARVQRLSGNIDFVDVSTFQKSYCSFNHRTSCGYRNDAGLNTWIA